MYKLKLKNKQIKKIVAFPYDDEWITKEWDNVEVD